MAVFGIQLVVTMVMASVMSKIVPHYSFAKWLLCRTGLIYYLHPSDDTLKEAAGIPKKAKGGSSNGTKGNVRNHGKGKKHEDEGSFSIPKCTEVELEISKITSNDVMQLRFYPDYQWLLDFSVCSIIVYVISEIYISLIPSKGEINLSMLWCLLVIGFCLKVMMSLTMLYFSGADSGGEKTMVIFSFFIYLLIALGLLIVSEEKLELGLDMAYSSFNESASAFLSTQGLQSVGPASKVTFKVGLAFTCAILGAFFTFPGLRLGKMHWDSLRLYGESKVRTILFHSSFIAPIVLVLLWVRPVGRKYFTEVTFSGYSQPMMTPAMFDLMRLTAVAVVGLIRIAMMPMYLQSYLNMAREKAEDLRKEAGKISNKQFQQMIARVFYYLCVVTLQYVVPVILCIFFALMCKTLGGYEWKDLVMRRLPSEEGSLNSPDDAVTPPLATLFQSTTVSEASKTLSLGIEELKRVFTTTFYQGLFGFFTWWSVFVWFLSSTFGVLYQSYFTQC